MLLIKGHDTSDNFDKVWHLSAFRLEKNRQCVKQLSLQIENNIPLKIKTTYIKLWIRYTKLSEIANANKKTIFTMIGSPKLPVSRQILLHSVVHQSSKIVLNIVKI